MEESDSAGCYQVNHPAGERRDRWKMRSMSWSEDSSVSVQSCQSPRNNDDSSTIYEYRDRSRTSSSLGSFMSTPISSAQTPIESSGPSLPQAPDLL
jgi:hypothetical protein